MRRHPSGEAVDDLGELLDALLILRDAQRNENDGLRLLPIYSDCFLLVSGNCATYSLGDERVQS